MGYPGKSLIVSYISCSVMRRNETRPIGEVIKECLDELNISRILKEKRLVSQWGEMLGKSISARTRQVYIKDRTLFVYMTSSVARNELQMMRQSILEKLNEIAGEKLIDSIVIR
jgi:predicted nucleic acid-binding Zn ribbon protein